MGRKALFFCATIVLILVILNAIYYSIKLSRNKIDFFVGNDDDDRVDAVVTWVTSKPSSWQRSFDAHCGSVRGDTSYDVSTSRYTSENVSDDFELRWCLRSILAFATWIHRIHLVVADESQIPYCLQTFSTNELQKINVVFHKDIFGMHCPLPTFNSVAIESRLHHIPGLSERFIYFNDDTYLGRHVSVENFFNKARPIFWNDTRWEAPKHVTSESHHFHKLTWNTLTKANVPHDEYRYNHLPCPLTKTLMLKYAHLYEDTCHHRCRSVKDIQSHVVVTSLGAMNNEVDIRSDRDYGMKVAYIEGLDANTILELQPHMFCINNNTDETGLNNLFQTLIQ